MANTVRSAIAIIRQTFRQLDIDLPPVVGEVNQLAELEPHRDSLNSPTAVAEAVTKALLAGHEPAASKEVQTAITEWQLRDSAIVTSVTAHIQERQRTLIFDRADEIIDPLAPVVADAEAAIRQALDAGVDFTDERGVTKLPPKTMRAWGEARDHMARLKTAADVAAMLNMAAHNTAPDSRLKPLLLADLNAEQLAALGQRPGSLAAATAGHALTLATPAVYDARCAAVRDQWVEANESAAPAAREAFRRAYKRSAGFGGIAPTFTPPAA